LPPQSVGGVAIVLAAEDAARRISDKPVWITGISWAIDSYDLGSMEISRLGAMATAAGKAYRMAGISDPVKDLDLAEVHDITAFHELMACEALGRRRRWAALGWWTTASPLWAAPCRSTPPAGCSAPTPTERRG
jgi:acetyl-CoA C-acetyltransferase